MPKFLLKQRQGWYAVLEIPKALRKHFGKVRFKQSLETDSLGIANSRVLPVIAEWKRQVAIAKGLEIGSNDELLATLALVRQDTQRHRRPRLRNTDGARGGRTFGIPRRQE
jgi:hypothetical protein